ncbi:MAG TPA: ATP-binding protein, partial [Chloroflexota bacterium]
TVWRFRHRDGSLLWVESYRTPIYDGDGRLVAVEGINRDITERKRGEERLLRAQRLEAAGLVAAQVAHDFNNLLAPLTGYPELIKNRLPPDHPAVAYCDAMLEAAQRMAEINQDLLTLGRRGRATREVVDLNRIVEEALAQVSTWPAAIALKLHLAEGLLPVDGSAVQFLRMVINLVNNAREAIEREGEVEIRTENVVLQRWDGRLRLPAGAYVRLVVRDTGCGIPPEIRDSIFEPFFTTKASGRRRGSGLGLSIVHAVVEDHGGAVDLESEVGRGTTFAVYLPAAGAERSKTPPEAPLTRLASNGGETVLVVDDDQEQRLRVRQLLEALGYHVVAAAHGEEAVAYLGRHPVDLVVLDVGSAPGADGAETYRRMLEVRPGQRAIVVSSNARSEAVRQAQALGAGARLCKPLSLERLGRAVREELDRGRR